MIDAIRDWAGLFALLIAIGGHVVYWFTASGSSAMKALKEHKDEQKLRDDKMQHKLIEHDRRVQTVEQELKHLPDARAIHSLEVAVERLNGRIAILDERLGPVVAISERMQELLLEQAKRS